MVNIFLCTSCGLCGLGLGFIVAIFVISKIMNTAKKEISEELRQSEMDFREKLIRRWETDSELKHEQNIILIGIRDDLQKS